MKIKKNPQTILRMLVAVLLFTGFSAGAWADYESSGTLTPTDDAYTWVVFENTVFDEGALGLSYTGSPDPHISRVSYLKFDLSGIPFPIHEARLNLAVVTGCFIPDEVNVTVYGALDVYDDTTTQWTENGLSWSNQPALDPSAAAPLITMDEGVVQPEGGYYHWTDTGAGYFADWLEAQRTGDEIATLRLEMIPNPNILIEDEVWFDDREGTAAGLPSCISSGGPMLQIADAEGPLSITLLDLQARAQAPVAWTIWAGLLALPLLVYVFYSMKKRAS